MEKIFSIDNFVDKQMLFGKGEGYEPAVKCGVELAEQYASKAVKEYAKYNGVELLEADKDYAQLNTNFQTLLFSYVYGDEKFDASNKEHLSVFRNNSRFNTVQRERYYDVIRAVMTTVTPAVASALIGSIAEIRNIGWGDTAEFEIESNEILIANRIAEGVPFGTNQNVYNDTVTINPTPLNITFATEWYQVAAGKADFGKMFFRASLGFTNYFAVEAYSKLTALASKVPAYVRYTGLTQDNLDLAVMAVSGANGGVGASIVGTLPALRDVLPSSDFLKVGISEEYVKMGYVGTWAGTPVVKVENLINPATINSNTGAADFLFKNDVLFVMPFVGRKPIKIVFEGDMFTIDRTAVETGDKTERASLTYRVGIDYTYDQIFGIISAE